MADTTKVIFLCTGNSCRSQMAEGFLNKVADEKIKAFSAGVEPIGINPKAIKVMEEVGIDISKQSSNAIDIDFLEEMDYVITLCDSAAKHCPIPPRSVKKLHWPIDDPADFNGTEKEVLDEFRRIRDEIEKKVKNFIQHFNKELC